MFNNIPKEQLLVFDLDTKVRMREIDVTPYIEKRVGLDFLPWARAQMILEEHFPDVRVGYETARMSGTVPGSPDYYLVPWFDYGDSGIAIYAYLYNSEGKRTPSTFFPVMDNRHKACSKPDVCVLNTNLKRAGVKAIAENTWIGFNLYLGLKEDIPEEAPQELSFSKKQPTAPKEDLFAPKKSQSPPQAAGLEAGFPLLATPQTKKTTSPFKI